MSTKIEYLFGILSFSMFWNNRIKTVNKQDNLVINSINTNIVTWRTIDSVDCLKM